MVNSPPESKRRSRSKTLEDRCPWCGQVISHEQFEEIHRRIEATERQRATEVKAKLKAEVAKARKEGAAELASTKKAARLQVAAARSEGKNAAEAAIGQKLAKAREDKLTAQKQLAAEKARQTKALEARLAEQRNALEKDKNKALNAEKARAFKNRQKLEERLQQLQRQLQNRTADELGEGAEIDLFEALKAAFPNDEIKRVKRGEEGADIVHTIIDKRRTCGSIVYDSKNRTAWRNDYVTKLRRDQLAAKADHAVLVCYAFPAGVRQLHVRGGVILANPARVLSLVELLRKNALQLAAMRLSTHARAEKMTRLYEFITSDHGTHLFDQIESLTDALLDLDVKEKKAHDSTWNKRGELVRAVQQVRSNLTTEIDRIVTTPARALQRVT